MLAFDMKRPETLEEAVALLGTEKGTVVPKAGGTDLLVWMKKHAMHPDLVVDLFRIPELREISFDPAEGLSIGSCVTLNEIAWFPETKKLYPSLEDALLSHSDHIIRNKATLGGNLCASVPSGDLIPSCVIHDARLHLRSASGSRVVPLAEFITGPRRNVLQKGEVLVKVVLPVPPKGSSGCYIKLARRNALDLAQIGVACAIFDSSGNPEYRLAYGAVAPVPLRATKAEELLRGVKDPDEALLLKAGEEAARAVNPITDVRASREYRISMARELTRKAVQNVHARIKEGALS
jgi:carbon-monoxide dehydrogenase medium subunit